MNDMEQDEEFSLELPLLWQFVHPEYARRGSDLEGSGESGESEEEEDIDGEEDGDEVVRKKNAPKLSKLLRFLNNVEDEEELERLLEERDPVTQQTLLQWATRQRHYMLAEYLVKRAKRAAFGFPMESTEMNVYLRWEEMRPELPTAAQLQAKQEERDKQRAERLAARKQQQLRGREGGGDNDEEEEEPENLDDFDYENEEEEEEEENEPLPEELVYEALEEYHDEWGDRGVGIVKQIGELGVYVGARLRDGTKQGLGQALFPNGDAYTGEYDNNQRHGFGLYWWAKQGVMYAGRWYRGVRHGYGRIVYPDGSRYLGGWSSNMKHGKGLYMYADGSSYNGTWNNNKKQGYGVYRFTDGSSFHGSFVDNEFVAGEWRLASGITRYIGNFSQDTPVGAGVFLHRLGDVKQRAFQQNGFYHKGEWHPGVLHGTTRVPPRLEVFAPNQVEPKRVPVTFAPECNGGKMVDLVKAVNFPPMHRWLNSLVPVSDSSEFGVVLMSIEICSLKYDTNDPDLVVEVRMRPVLRDLSGGRLRISTTEDETIILKERTTRLLLVVEKVGETYEERDPMVVLERSVQMASAGIDHMQLRLPTVQVLLDGEIDGTFARIIKPALRIKLNQQTTVKQLFPPLKNNLFLGDAEEDVLMYIHQWHSDAHSTLEEKLRVASMKLSPPPPPAAEEEQEKKQAIPKKKEEEKKEEKEEEETKKEEAAQPELQTSSASLKKASITQGCSYVAVPLRNLPVLSKDAITVVAATSILRRRQLGEVPIATAPAQRPPTPIPPPPEPRPELQPLYDALKVMRLDEEDSDEENEGIEQGTAEKK